jgi:phage gpG-like protein
MATVRGMGVIVQGLPEVQKAFARIEGGRGNFGVEYELQHRLRNIGEHVAEAAPRFVTHRTGRHGDPRLPRLEDDVRVSVTTRSASVYSTSPYAPIQNFGGGPKAGWGARGPHVTRARASKWLNKAVASERQYVKDEFQGLLDWIEAEWNR